MIRLTFILLIVAHASSAQNFLSWQFKDRYFSTTLGTGATTYFGELNHNNSISGNLSQINAGIEARLLSRVAARLEATYFTTEGDDRNAPDSSFQRQRNLNFQSRNFHIQLNALYYLKSYSGDYHSRWVFDPYLFTGIGYLFYNPRTTLGEEEFSLRSAQTEGVAYNKWAITIPAGFGLKFKLNEFTNFIFEAGYHFTFTDYLDDVSSNFASEFPNGTTELLSIRKDEIGVVNTTFYDEIQPGSRGGDSSNKDAFLQVSLKL